MIEKNRFDKFTARARKVLTLSQEEAQRFQHNYIGTEHLLLGLIKEGEGVAAKVLQGLGVELAKVRSAVEFIIGRGDRIVLGELGLTPRAKKVIELAVEEARRLNHHYIGTEHILLGLVREGEGIGAGVLESLGVGLENLRSYTIRYLSDQNGGSDSPGDDRLEQKSSSSNELESRPKIQYVPVQSNQASHTVSTSDDSSFTMKPEKSSNKLTVAHQKQLATIPFCHVHAPEIAPTRVVSWLWGAAAAGWPLPLAFASDLGLLLTQPAARRFLIKPAYLPFDEDTSAYLACLQRLAAHPLIRELPEWSPPLSDAVLCVLLARLVEGLNLSQDYRLPSGPDGASFLRTLDQELAHVDPTALWQKTPGEARPSWRRLLPPSALARLERNLLTLDREELRFLALYGPELSGSPDPRTLLDLLALIGLPAPARLALNQTLRLLPQVSATHHPGGIQTYPEGGYEGLARQGSLESLLPGENVYPDSLFLHRVLNHEALYYGRERPREQRRELVYLVGQLGWGLGGDGQVLVRALLLALGQAMRQRGYEVFYSLAGASLSAPYPLEKPSEVGRLLYAQEPGGVNSEVILQGVLEQLRSWRSEYHGKQVLWVLSENFDQDDALEHVSWYQALQAEGEQQVWYIRVGAVSSQSMQTPPVTARYFGHWQIIESGCLWSTNQAEMQ